MRVDGFPRGTHACVRTDEGRFAEIRFDATVLAGANQVVLTDTTWER